MNETEKTPMQELGPRAEMTPERIKALLDELKWALDGAEGLNFFERMELNHDSRYCWWPGQTVDGRKWPHAQRKLMPGQRPGDVFPWAGASDSRVPLVEEILLERVMFKRLALQRSQMRIGPRNFTPDVDPQARAAVWGQTAEYYEDVARESMRTAGAQLADIAEEYGHGVLYIGWDAQVQLEKRTLTGEQVAATAAGVAMGMAEQAAAEAGRELEEYERMAVLEAVQEQLAELLLDDGKKKALVAALMSLDPQMVESEAKRVAKDLKVGKEAVYYATVPAEARPMWRALTPFLDVWYPATTTRLQDAPWIAMSEWLTEAELRERIDTRGYAAAWVEQVLKHSGRAVDWADEPGGRQWVLNNGTVRTTVGWTPHDNQDERKLFQIAHVFYRSTAIGNVATIYHTVVHGSVQDLAGVHECCEYAHGRYPFVEHVREPAATYLLASRGIGEIVFTQQNEVKVQRDLRCDNAAMLIKPPMRVPLNQAGGQLDLRPAAQLPMRSSAGMGLLEPLKIGADPRGSQEVEATTRAAVDAYFGRGPNVDPEVKIAHRQLLVSDWLADVRAAKLMTFQLVQEFSPESVRASFVGGLAVELHVTKEEIQGQVAMELDFDVADFDPSLVEQRTKAIAALKSFDNEGLIQTEPILRALAAYLLPSHFKLLVGNPRKQAEDEAEEERKIVGDLLNGLEGPYVPGKNHALRLGVLQEVFGCEVDKKGKVMGMRPVGLEGTFSKPQRLAMEDPDVKALVERRLEFHAFQMQQMENADTGRLGVESVREEARPLLPAA